MKILKAIYNILLFNWLKKRKYSRFSFSNNSKQKLSTVHSDLQKVAKTALSMSLYDFRILAGKRTLARQKQLLKQGKTQTLDSKHLKGLAIDIAAMNVFNQKITWQLEYYCHIANAFKYAAKLHNVKIRWGGAWTVSDLAKSPLHPLYMMKKYVYTRQKQNRKPFRDAGHFELNS